MRSRRLVPPGRRQRRCSTRIHAAGFTLVELVMTMVIIGILAAIAIPKLYDRLTFDARGFTDQVRAALQFAQRTAVAQRRNVCVTVTASTLSMTKAPSAGPGVACSLDVIDPATGAPFSLAAPNGVSLSPVTVTFDGLGQVAGNVTVTVSGDVNRTIAVEQVTGYVR